MGNASRRAKQRDKRKASANAAYLGRPRNLPRDQSHTEPDTRASLQGS